jgi:hypothetical protein
MVGGRPYTPYDYDASSLIENYNINKSGILDYTLLNTERYDLYHQLDVRLDKTWYWKHFSLNFYVDIQNILATQTVEQPYLLAQTDADGNYIVDPADNTRYLMEEIANDSGNILPRFGVIIDF